MKKTATESAERATGSRSSSSRSDANKPKGLTFDLRLRYYNRMKLQRVYPLIVEVPYGTNAKGPTGVTVELRPVVAGAVVTPASQRLDVTRPGAQAVFQVAPLVRGRLPAAHVDVVHEGRTIQELRMGMKAGTQRMTWLLLLLTLVLPPLFYHYTVYEPLKDSLTRREMARATGSKTSMGEVTGQQPARNGEPAEDKPADKPQGGGMAPPTPSPPIREETKRAATPGESLAFRIKTKADKIIPEVKIFTDVDYVETAINKTAEGLGWIYQQACDYSDEARPGLFLCFFLVIATCASWFLHLPARRKSNVKLTLPAPAAVATLRAADDGETLPLASAGQDDIGTVQAADD
jgi:hypothetical protein